MQEHFDLEACGIVYKAADGLSIRTIPLTRQPLSFLQQRRRLARLNHRGLP